MLNLQGFVLFHSKIVLSKLHTLDGSLIHCITPKQELYLYRLYNKVEVSTGYTLLSAAGRRLCRRDQPFLLLVLFTTV